MTELHGHKKHVTLAQCPTPTSSGPRWKNVHWACRANTNNRCRFDFSNKKKTLKLRHGFFFSKQELDCPRISQDTYKKKKTIKTSCFLYRLMGILQQQLMKTSKIKKWVKKYVTLSTYTSLKRSFQNVKRHGDKKEKKTWLPTTQEVLLVLECRRSTESFEVVKRFLHGINFLTSSFKKKWELDRK